MQLKLVHSANSVKPIDPAYRVMLIKDEDVVNYAKYIVVNCLNNRIQSHWGVYELALQCARDLNRNARQAS